MKSKLLTKKSLLPVALAVLLLLGLSYAANVTIVVNRLDKMIYEKEYGARNSEDGQYSISFKPIEEGKAEGRIDIFLGQFYCLPVSVVPEEYEGSPIVTIAVESYSDAPNLQKVILPQTIRTIEEKAFFNDKQLEEVYIPASVEKISKDAFGECENLTLYVEKGSYAETFAKENKLPYKNYKPEELDYAPANGEGKAVRDKSYDDDIMYYDMIYDYTGTALCAITHYDSTSAEHNPKIPSQINGVDVKNISENAFEHGDSLQTVTLPDTLVSIGTKAFKDCGGLEKIYIPDNVAFIADDAFEGSSQVTICAPKDSYACQYARDRKLKFEEWKAEE